MKYSSIILTEKNMDQIAGKIKKFFKNDLGTNYTEWHNWDSSWNFKPYHIRKSIYTPDIIESNRDYNCIRICWNYGSGYILSIGTRIRFQNNKVLIQIPWHDSNIGEYLYIAFQHNKDTIKIQL